jgi:pyruvate,water dikinase
MLAELVGHLGRRDALLELISGLGDVESASPSWGLWELSRIVRGSAELAALFDRGPQSVAAALAGQRTGELQRFGVAFDRFLDEYGMRGPNADFRAALPAFGARINLAWADGLSLG